MNESISGSIATIRICYEDENVEALILDALLKLKKTMSSLGFLGSSFNSRKSNISNCLKKDISAVSFINGVLKQLNAINIFLIIINKFNLGRN